MVENERKQEIIDVVVTIIFFITLCVLGKLGMMHFWDT